MKLKYFFDKYKNIIRAIFIIFIISITIYVINKEIKNINMHDLKVLMNEMSLPSKIFFVVFGLFCFSFATIYDFLLVKYYKMDIPSKEVFKIGWISQSFSNFVGFAGMAGLTLRELMYDKYKIDKNLTNRILFIVLFSDMVGLFSLGLPSSISLIIQKYYSLVPILFIMFLLVIVFIFIDLLPISHFIKDDGSVFKREQRPLRLYITLQSTFEWFLAALFFAVTIKYFEADINILQAVTVYVLATIIGLLSMIPGGLGAFEASAIFLFSLIGYSTPNIVLSLLICRICYTIIPWIVGLLLLASNTKDQNKEDFIKKANSISNILAYILLVVGALIVASIILPRIFLKYKFIRRIFPTYLMVINKQITLISGFSLMAISNGIRNRVKLAHALSIVLLVTLIILYALNGQSYMEIVICAALIYALFINRQYFDGLADRISIKKILIASVFIFIFYAILAGVYNYKHNIDFINGFEKYSLAYIKRRPLKSMMPILITISIYSIFLGLDRRYMPFKTSTKEDMEKFEDFHEKYPYSLTSHSFYMGDKNVFYNSKNTVSMIYRPYKDKIFVFGNPTGLVEDFEEAMDELIEIASAHKMDVAFYQISGKYLEYFVNEGFNLLKLGETALINLNTFSMEGKKFKIMRRTLNSMDGLGLKFKVNLPPFSDDFLNKLNDISIEWLGKRKEMQFSVGSFDRNYLQKAPIFTIEDQDKIYAFANMFPVKGTKTFSIDLMRHVNEMPSGLMDMMFLSIINWGKAEGYDTFDLGVAPLSNIGNKMYSSTKEKAIKLVYRYGNKIYGFKGLRKFKNKYNPEWKSVFLAYKDEFNLIDTLIKQMNLINGYGDKQANIYDGMEDMIEESIRNRSKK